MTYTVNGRQYVAIASGGTVRLGPWDADVVHAPNNNPYRGHRFPGEIISQVVWLYFRLPVSYRDVEEMMAMRGVQLTYETVREWCGKFGSHFAEELRRRNKRKLGSKWHLDEVFLKINGMQQYLWRAVDQNGAVIDILVQPKRDRIAAERFFRKLLQRAGRKPKVIVTDKLRSYGAAKRHPVPRGCPPAWEGRFRHPGRETGAPLSRKRA